jgi:hypothetical protein
VRSRKSSKYEENEYKSSLDCLSQKPIGALNSAKIGGMLSQNKLKDLFFFKLVRSGKSSKYN